MDRRSFLKRSSVAALVAVSEWSGLTKAFAQSESNNSKGKASGCIHRGLRPVSDRVTVRKWHVSYPLVTAFRSAFRLHRETLPTRIRESPNSFCRVAQLRSLSCPTRRAELPNSRKRVGRLAEMSWATFG